MKVAWQIIHTAAAATTLQALLLLSQCLTSCHVCWGIKKCEVHGAQLDEMRHFVGHQFLLHLCVRSRSWRATVLHSACALGWQVQRSQGCTASGHTRVQNVCRFVTTPSYCTVVILDHERKSSIMRVQCSIKTFVHNIQLFRLKALNEWMSIRFLNTNMCPYSLFPPFLI